MRNEPFLMKTTKYDWMLQNQGENKWSLYSKWSFELDSLHHMFKNISVESAFKVTNDS